MVQKNVVIALVLGLGGAYVVSKQLGSGGSQKPSLSGGGGGSQLLLIPQSLGFGSGEVVAPLKKDAGSPPAINIYESKETFSGFSQPPADITKKEIKSSGGGSVPLTDTPIYNKKGQLVGITEGILTGKTPQSRPATEFEKDTGIIEGKKLPTPTPKEPSQTKKAISTVISPIIRKPLIPKMNIAYTTTKFFRGFFR